MSGESQIVKYGSFDLTQMQEEADKLPAAFNQGFKPKQGVNIVRFIPPVQGHRPMKTWHKHFFKAGGQNSAVVCAKLQEGQPCPICEKGQRLRASGNRADAQAARAFEPRSSAYVNVVDMEEPEKGVQVWKMSPGLFKDIMAAIEMADVGKVFADPARGYNIKFKRKGEGLATEYTGHSVARESSALPNADELIQGQPDLETVEQLPSDEEQDAALDGEFEAGGKQRGGGDRGDRGSRRQEKDVTPRRDDDDMKY